MNTGTLVFSLTFLEYVQLLLDDISCQLQPGFTYICVAYKKVCSIIWLWNNYKM